MFIKSLRQIARPAPPSCCTSSLAPWSVTVTATASIPITASRHPQHQHYHRHQRRHSSSKTSSASGGAKGQGPEQPANNASASASASAPSANGERRPSSRLTRQKSKEAAAAELAMKMKTKPDGAVFNVPAVPPTTHLQLQDVAISSFFSLHRPISVTAALPTSSSIDSFNAIFDPPKPIKPNDVIFTLSNALSALENAGKGDKDLRWEIMQQSSSNADPGRRGAVPVSPEQYAQQLQKLTQTFRPFNVPPPPRPFPDSTVEAQQKAASRKSTGSSRRSRKTALNSYEEQPVSQQCQRTTENAPQRSSRNARRTRLARPSSATRPPTFFTMNMTIHEVPTQRGRKRFSLTNASSGLQQKLDARFTTSTHYELPQAQQRPTKILFISVKRQRKLKMKKHKYKKLMKRTRNLRRREGRL